ncbi:MAG: DUF5663 domain-containing protein [Candidatus Saccharibacteria bacterium]|nr:DUF5663 domain-containing protein [Candidatus Saccharibacteria bacterium]
MFQLDENFLQELGLGQLPEGQRQAFLEQVYSSLEGRVGVQLSEGLTDAQLEEFEGIIDRDEAKVSQWLAAHAPDFQQDQVFIRLQQASKMQADNITLQAEYAATKWLEVNRPDYRDVVARVMEDLKKEILANREAILASIQ